MTKAPLSLLTILLLLSAGVAHSTETKKISPSKSTQAKDDDSDDDDDDDAATPPRADGQAHTAAKAKSEESDDSNDEDEEDSYDPTNPVIATATMASDYVLRGVSQTARQPALQGGFDWTPPVGVYLGAWGSNVHLPASQASVELDAYGGYTYHFTDDLNLSLGALYYTYWADHGRDSWDIPLRAEWKTFSLEMDYSPNWNGANNKDFYFLAGWKDEIVYGFKFGLYIGYSVFDGNSGSGTDMNYADYRVSLSRKFLGLDFDISENYVNHTYISAETAGSNVVFSVSKSI